MKRFRTSPPLLYGAKMTIKEIASVHSISGGVEVTPYDKNLIKSIEKRLNDSDLGLVTKKENSVLLKFPPLSLEFCQNICKKVTAESNDENRKIRDIRHRELDNINSMKKTNENLYFKTREKIDKITSEYCDKIKVYLNSFTDKWGGSKKKK